MKETDAGSWPMRLRAVTAREVAAGVSVDRLVMMAAALVSLFLDQSFGGVYNAVQSFVGGSLSTSADELSWTNVGYSAFYDTMIVLTPWLVKRFGRRFVFSAGHIGFFFITAYLATTSSVLGFIGGRALQGVAQGTFFVCSVLTVVTLFPPQYRGYAFSLFSITSLSGAASGPFIGGWFVDHSSWQGAFALFACLALFAGVTIAIFLDAPKPDLTRHPDAAGVALAFAGFTGIAFIVAFGERRDWFGDASVVGFTALAVGGLAGFVYRELTACEPFTPLLLYRIRNLAIGSVLGFGLGAPLFGANAFLAYTGQQLGFPPSTAGALLLFRIVTIVFVAPTAVLLVNADKLNVKIPVIGGFLLVAASYGLLAGQTTFESAFPTFAFAIALSGAGFACCFSPIANVTVRSLPAEFAGEGVGIFKIVLVLGGSLAATLLNVLYDHDYAGFLARLADDATLSHLQRIGIFPDQITLAQLVAQQASVLAYARNLAWVALISLAALPFAFLLKRPNVQPTTVPTPVPSGRRATPPQRA